MANHSTDDGFVATLAALLGSGYRIIRELGRGGMARVYLAQDLKHSREVAIKVIRPDVAEALGRERFLREIAIAARLRHPNIVPLYDSGDAGGMLYFVMPFEPGPSLRARLEAGPLPPNEAMRILADVARALTHAHAHGVIHRDIKPDNILLSGGAAVVADFGIAKAAGGAQVAQANAAITEPGWGVGTPAYMAPEQAVGDLVDARADLFSFGRMASELFGGAPPAAVAPIIAQCLQLDPAARPSTAQQVLDAFGGAGTASAHPGPRAAVARQRRLIAVALLLVAGAGALWWSARSASSGPLTVAVLPLRPLNGDSLLGEGVSDQVAIALGQVQGLLVKSRQGVGNYRGQDSVNAQAAGRALGARFLVMGSLGERDGRLSANVLLVRADDARQLWARHFDRRSSDLEALCDSIARAVGDTLQRLYAPRALARAPATVRVRRSGGEAYRLRVLAQRQLDRRGLSVRASAENFRKALALDSLDADSWSGLSLALALFPYFQGVPASDVHDEVRSAAERALRLDSTLSQPHVALGLALQHDRRWDAALAEFRAAVARNPRDVEAHVQLGRHLLNRGRFAEGRAEFMRAHDDDPASALVSSWIAYGDYLVGQLGPAVAEGRRALQDDSTNLTAVANTAFLLLKHGDRDEARALANRTPNYPLSYYVLAALGDRAVVTERLAVLAGTRPPPSLAWTARSYAALGFGDSTAALNALEQATFAGEIWPNLIGGVRDPLYDPVRVSARFQRLIAVIGATSASP